MEKHARERLKQRYSKPLTTALRNALIKRIETGKAIIVNNRPDKNGVRVECWYRDVYYKFIYCPIEKEIITFIP